MATAGVQEALRTCGSVLAPGGLLSRIDDCTNILRLLWTMTDSFGTSDASNSHSPCHCSAATNVGHHDARDIARRSTLRPAVRSQIRMHLDLRDDGLVDASPNNDACFLSKGPVSRTEFVDQAGFFRSEGGDWNTCWTTSTKPRHKEKLQQCRHHSRDRAATGGSFVREQEIYFD